MASFTDVGFPLRFRIAEYECVWTEGAHEYDEVTEIRRATGGFVAIRVDATGDDTLDWRESDVQADTLGEAHDIARALIAEYEDATTEDVERS